MISPPDVTPGDHKGTLTIVLPGVAAENYPTCPIEVSYTENPWRVWFMARTWLAVAVVLFAATYLLCVILFPVPNRPAARQRLAVHVDLRRRGHIGPTHPPAPGPPGLVVSPGDAPGCP